MNSTIKYSIIFTLVLLIAIIGFLLYSNQAPSTPPVDQSDNSDIVIAPATSESPTFTDTIWRATSIKNTPPLQNTSVTIQFDEQGRVNGSDSCNTFSSGYILDGSNLSIDQSMVSTKKACKEEIMKQADLFTKTLLATTSLELGDGILVLYQGNLAGLVFTGQSNSLSKTSWNVTGYNNGQQAVVSPIADTTLTVTFGDDGTISGSSGCNNFTGQYSLTGQTIEIGQLATTLMACVEPEGILEQETAFINALQSATTWQIQGDQLFLRADNDEIAVTALNNVMQFPQ